MLWPYSVSMAGCNREGRIRSQPNPFVICGGKCWFGTGFSPSTSVFPLIVCFHQGSTSTYVVSFIFHRHFTVCNLRNWQLPSTKEFSLCYNRWQLFSLLLVVHNSNVVRSLLRVTWVTHFKIIFLSSRHIASGDRKPDWRTPRSECSWQYIE